MSKLTAVEWDIIDARVRAEQRQRRLRNSSLAFLRLVLDNYFPAKGGVLDDLVTDGPNDHGIDAIEIVQRDHQAEIFLFQAKYREARTGTDRTINDTEVLRALSFLHELFERSETLVGTGNLALDEAVTRIWRLHKDGMPNSIACMSWTNSMYFTCCS